ncbi:MAG: glutamate 5-kinase [Chloroherpetonaceae bacterium]|nr:glutamate 5-kinase [Chthonomonadaceae bacterium]MDW8209327.1 glutamate 5-kinase [Chloroherpetonaceae bacterium]
MEDAHTPGSIGLSEAARRASRLVIKVGTSTLTDAQGRIDRAFIADLTAQLAALRLQGSDVVFVSSGAIRAGRELLPSRTPDTLPYKQAAAAIGQGRLMHLYTEAFAWRNVPCAQVLLTREDLADRRRFLNARNTLQTLLALGVVPVINENDTVSVDEIKFGDNDTLAALVATLVEADLLLILSDVEGLYDRPPQDPEARLIPLVPRVDRAVLQRAGGSVSGMGTGGMRTKVEAARIATGAGIRTVIARGRRERVVLDVVAGHPIGTTFLPCTSTRLPARKRWIAHGLRPRGLITVNAGAAEKLRRNGVSLLAVGITHVAGTFASGDLIEVCDEQGCVFARGLTNYPSDELRRIQGLRSEQFESVLGYRGFEEVIHRDNLVLDGSVDPVE